MAARPSATEQADPFNDPVRWGRGCWEVCRRQGTLHSRDPLSIFDGINKWCVPTSWWFTNDHKVLWVSVAMTMHHPILCFLCLSSTRVPEIDPCAWLCFQTLTKIVLRVRFCIWDWLCCVGTLQRCFGTCTLSRAAKCKPCDWFGKLASVIVGANPWPSAESFDTAPSPMNLLQKRSCFEAKIRTSRQSLWPGVTCLMGQCQISNEMDQDVNSLTNLYSDRKSVV